MLLDKESSFSDDQAITAAGNTVSTDTIDTGADHDVGVGNPVSIFANVTASFVGNASVQAVLQTSGVLDFSTDTVDLMAGPVVPVAELAAGKVLLDGKLPHGAKRYLRMKYVNVGTATAGTIYAGLVLSSPSRTQYPNRSEIL